MGNVAGIAKNMDVERMFEIQIDGCVSAKFSESSEISVELGKFEYQAGGEMLPTKGLTGSAKVGDVTLKRGVCGDYDLYLWFSTCANMASAALGGPGGLPSPTYKRTGDWVQLELDGSVKLRWRLTGMFPTKFVAGKWDAKSDSVVVEEIVLAYDFPQLIA